MRVQQDLWDRRLPWPAEWGWEVPGLERQLRFGVAISAFCVLNALLLYAVVAHGLPLPETAAAVVIGAFMACGFCIRRSSDRRRRCAVPAAVRVVDFEHTSRTVTAADVRGPVEVGVVRGTAVSRRLDARLADGAAVAIVVVLAGVFAVVAGLSLVNGFEGRRIAGSLVFGALALALVGLLRRIRRTLPRLIMLAPAQLFVVTRRETVAIPWSEIVAIDPAAGFLLQPWIKIEWRSEGREEQQWVTPLGWDLDPVVLLDLLIWMMRNPAAREELANGVAVEKVRSMYAV